MMAKNLILFSVITVSCHLIGANTVFAFPGLSELKTDQQPKCPKINTPVATLLPHETDCSLYYICESGVPILRYCPDELHFNPRSRVCDFPERAGCEKGEKAEKPLRSVGYPHSDCPSKDLKNAVILPHESDCSKFYICSNGFAYEKTCLFDLHFNPKIRVCDYPDKAKCDEGLSKKENDRQPKCPKVNKSVATLLPHETDCSLYYICESGVPILRDCPEDLHFNPRSRVCDFPYRSGCEKGETREKILKSVGYPHSDCPSKDLKNAVILPHESDCSKFYICSNGFAYEKTCLFDLHFNPKLRVCDYPDKAKCNLEFSKQETDKQPQCPKINQPTATLLPHETDCDLYYICESGEPILRFCPDGLHFHPKKKVCDFPENAKCETGEIHVHLAPPEATGSSSPFCPMINGNYPIFFPHPTDCSSYYMCGNGLAYEFTCPSGLHFNVRLKTCDFPWRAKCTSQGF